ncbi:hypothetical protein EB73_35530 [Mycobacterium sp. SWH-M3]|nr:hypothetical protein EB73_35530 [Mycobacterium sp. SWH-M3]
MFVAISTYTKPLEDVDTTRTRHLDWIARQYDSGKLLVSGRQNPAVGGVIVGRAASIDAFRDLLADDPFVRSGLAEYRIVEFEPTAAALQTPGFAAFVGSGR